VRERRRRERERERDLRLEPFLEEEEEEEDGGGDSSSSEGRRRRAESTSRLTSGTSSTPADLRIFRNRATATLGRACRGEDQEPVASVARCRKSAAAFAAANAFVTVG
jgi:hypothetical protein